MLRLDQLYFRNFSILFFATLLVTAVSGYILLKKIEINNHKTMLSNMIDQYIVTEKHVTKPSHLIDEIHRKTGVRITIIREGMEYHRNRPEIVEAMRKGTGVSVRYSKSIGRDFLYVAKRDGKRFVRMAYPLANIQEKFFQFWLRAMLLFVAAFALAFWIAMRINKRVSRDLELIGESLENMLNKSYEIPFDDVGCCKEFDTIARQVKKVSKKLQKRDRQKAKYTKNLKMLSKKQSDIISAISHEFKNPIAAITGYAQTIREDRNLNSAIRDRFLEKVLSNARKISVMIDRLALAIKLENENFSPDYSTFSLLKMVEDVKEDLLQKYRDREIVIDVEDVTIRGDRAMFNNLLTNLIENALKYSEEEVEVRLREGRVEVIDSGIGIAPEYLESITKRFFRVDALSWDNSIGVGLYIVKYILKLHNSYLEIESTPGKGSKFWFDIHHLIVA